MLKALRLAICLIAGLAVPASGCGSTKTASTPTTATASKTASTNAGTTGPAGKGAQTATQSTGATHVPQTATAKAKPEGREKAAEAKPEQKASKKRAEAVKPRVESAEQIPLSHRYPRTFQLSWIVSCEAAKGSNSSCECILRKLEKSNVERGQSMAELFALELELKHGVSLQKAMHHGVELPRRVQRDAEECGRHS